MGFVSVEITGHKKIDRVLSNLPDKLQRKVIISAFRKASQPLLSRMRSLSPQGDTQFKNYRGQLHIPGWLKKSHGVVPGKSKQYPAIWIGPRVGKKYKYDGFYFKFIIQGSEFKAKQVRSPIPNWMEKAMNQTEPISKAIITKELTLAMQRNVKSLVNEVGSGTIKSIQNIQA